jgi:hypothetical protein
MSEIVLLLVCLALFAHAEIRMWRSAPDLHRLQEINVQLTEHLLGLASTARRDATQAYCDLLNAAQGLRIPASMTPGIGALPAEGPGATGASEDEDESSGPDTELAKAWLAEQAEALEAEQTRRRSLKAQPEPEHSMAG